MYIPPAVVGFACPAASPTITVFPSMNFSIGPFTQIGANIFLIVENFPLSLRILSNVSDTLIPFPATPTLPFPSLDGIIHAKTQDIFLDQKLLLLFLF